MHKKQLPPHIKFNTLYFFEYKGIGDVSESQKGVSIMQLNCFYYLKNNVLKCELYDKIYTLHFRSAWETVMWKEGLCRV